MPLDSPGNRCIDTGSTFQWFHTMWHVCITVRSRFNRNGHTIVGATVKGHCLKIGSGPVSFKAVSDDEVLARVLESVALLELGDTRERADSCHQRVHASQRCEVRGRRERGGRLGNDLF